MHRANSNGKGAAGRSNGSASPPPSTTHTPHPSRASASPPAPPAIADLADGCVRHVERLLGVKLDYEPETLPVLDHYIALARAEARLKPEVLSVLAQTAGAYIGEVVRRRYASWWQMDSSDPTDWQVEFESVYLAFNPMQLVLEAVLRVGPPEERVVIERPAPKNQGDGDGDDDDDDDPAEEKDADRDEERPEEEEESAGGTGDEVAQLELEEQDHAAVAARLAELPPVSEEEFYAPSTRVEVIDIAVEAIRARRLAEGDDADTKFSPIDYRNEE